MAFSGAFYRRKLITWDVKENGCWECTSHPCTRFGYHAIRRLSLYAVKRMYIHRLIYEECFGEIPEGIKVLHKCDNPHCINPEHLFLGTMSDNVQDMLRKRRNNPLRGERSPHAKLKEIEVLEIINCLKNGESPRVLAEKYHVSGRTIYSIKNGEKWTYLKAVI